MNSVVESLESGQHKVLRKPDKVPIRANSSFSALNLGLNWTRLGRVSSASMSLM